MSGPARPSLLSGAPPALGRVLTILLATLALLAAAALNGFPFVHFDTRTYIASSVTLTVPSSHPIFYSLFIRLSRLLAASLWATALLQSLLTAVLMDLFLRVRAIGRDEAGVTLVIVTVLLVALSSVAWVSAYLMADAFTGLMFLAVMTLLLGGDRLGWTARLFLLLVTAFTVATHASHALILLLFLVALAWLVREARPLRQPAYRAAWAAFAAGLIAMPIVHRAFGQSGSLPHSGTVMLLGRWIADGSVVRMLDERCGVADYALCPYREQLRGVDSNWFLWSTQSPLRQLGGVAMPASAVEPMLRDTLRYRPLDVAGGAAVAVAKQLLLFRAGAYYRPDDDPQTMQRAIGKFYPDDYERWQHSAQQRGTLMDAAIAFAWLHVPIAFAGIALLVLVAVPLGPARGVADQSRLLARALLCFLVANAVVCATLSRPADRYQSRVIWLVGLVAFEIVWAERARRRAGTAIRQDVRPSAHTAA